MLIAIDHGNYAIKTPHDEFVAGLAQHSTRPPMVDEVLCQPRDEFIMRRLNGIVSVIDSN